MIFMPDSIELILGLKIKTQTRRPWKEGDEILDVRIPNGVGYDTFEAVFRNGKRLWMIGNEYAIQPGRGKKAVGRIRITSLRLQTLGGITDEDAKREGLVYYPKGPGRLIDFFAYGERLIDALSYRAAYLALWQSMYGHAEASEKVWALSFEVCKEAT